MILNTSRQKCSAPLLAAFFAIAIACSASAAAPAKTPAPPKAPAATQPKSMPPLPGPAKDDPAKVAVAREFILLYHPRMNPLNISVRIQKMMPMMIGRATQENPKLDVKKFASTTRTKLMQQAATALDHQSHVVSRHFTLQELKALVAFYRSPLGAKLVAENNNIQRELLTENRRARAAAMAAHAKPAKVEVDEDDDDDDSANKSLTHPPKQKN